eukprot:gene13447-19305_t
MLGVASMLALALALCLHSASAFYLPGVAPLDFRKKDMVGLKVNKLSSIKTQLPYEYYSLPYCRPEKVIQSAENLGEVLRGDRIENSLYQVQMRVDEQCKLLCRIPSMSAKDAKAFQNKIDDDYRVNMILDNLPVAMVKMKKDEGSNTLLKTYERGYPVGFKASLESQGDVKYFLHNHLRFTILYHKDGQYDVKYFLHHHLRFTILYHKGQNDVKYFLYNHLRFTILNRKDGQKDVKYFLHNHLRFTILYHKDPVTDLARIVGFEVEPFSVKHDYEAPWDSSQTTFNTCNPGRMVYVTHNLPPQPVEDGAEVIFSYDAKFVTSDIKWASRWDTYLLMTDAQIHWFSIINSVMIVLFLSGMVAMIMLSTLARDIKAYNQISQEDAQEETGWKLEDAQEESGWKLEDAQEESGWKLVHGDVFRAPSHPSLLATYLGTGVQILGMSVVTMFFALLGFLSPANRGGLMTAVLMMFVFMGLFAGYVTGHLYRSFKGEEWKKTTLQTALLFPGICFVIFFALNLMIWGQKSSGAVPFGTLFALCFLWFGISVPLVFVGSYFGYKKPPPEEPVRTNKIPRQVPEQPWYMNPIFSCMLGGVLPFGAVFIELFFILTSMWLHQFYYLFGFLALVFVILLITCAEITIVLCYFQLCSEDYNWQWRAYFTSGSSAVYLFIYSAFYFYSKLDITKTVPMLMYFGYMLIASYGFFCLTGTIGFFACYYFVRTIYGAVKVFDSSPCCHSLERGDMGTLDGLDEGSQGCMSVTGIPPAEVITALELKNQECAAKPFGLQDEMLLKRELAVQAPPSNSRLNKPPPNSQLYKPPFLTLGCTSPPS